VVVLPQQERDAAMLLLKQAHPWRGQRVGLAQGPQGPGHQAKHPSSAVNRGILSLTSSGAKALQQAGHPDAFWHHDRGGTTMAIKVKEIEMEADELEALIAGVRLLAEAPEETWSQYVSRHEHLDDLLAILKQLEVAQSYVLRSVRSREA
jgi:hypothetical protein